MTAAIAANCEPRTATTAMLSVAPQADRVEPRISAVPARTTSGRAARVTSAGAGARAAGRR